MPPDIQINANRIKEFCGKWQIIELSLFGSILRDDFRPDSDVDVLVSFAPDAKTSYWDWPEMQDELKDIFGHDADIVIKEGLVNPYRRRRILTSRKVIYAH